MHSMCGWSCERGTLATNRHELEQRLHELVHQLHIARVDVAVDETQEVGGFRNEVTRQKVVALLAHVVLQLAVLVVAQETEQTQHERNAVVARVQICVVTERLRKQLLLHLPLVQLLTSQKQHHSTR